MSYIKVCAFTQNSKQANNQPQLKSRLYAAMVTTPVEVHTLIKCPIKDVFSYVANSENNNKWQNGVLKIKKTSTGPVVLGTGFIFKRKILGKLIYGNLVVHSYEENKKYGYKTTSANIDVVADYSFSSQDNHTFFTVKLDIDLGKYSRLTRPLIRYLVKRRYEKDLPILKAILEA